MDSTKPSNISTAPHQLSPEDRTGALLFAEARCAKATPKVASTLLDPIAANEKDTAFLALFGEALLRTHRLDRSREIFEAYYKQKPEGFSKLFELAGAYILDGDDAKAATLLVQTKDLMRSFRRETELVAHMDQMAATFPTSLASRRSRRAPLRGVESRNEIFRRAGPPVRSLPRTPAK